MGIGVVVPGVSSTVLLIFMGIYNTYLLAVSTVDISILFPMGIGLLLGGYVFLKITKYCLDNFHVQTYYTILGFVLGSIPVLSLGIFSNSIDVISVIAFLLGVYIPKILKQSH